MLIQKDKKGNVIGANKPRIIGSRFCIRPNYIVRQNIWFSPKEKVKLPARETDKNLSVNSHTGEMSEQSQKKIRCAINWLTTCARQKWIPECKEHKGFYFKVNFITLTLPCTGSHITHDNINKLLLAPFLDYARKMWGLSAYVWKIELQANGNPHVHLTTDTYIHWTKLRNYWNKLCSKEGLTQQYTAKYLSCKFDFYLKNNPATDLVSVANRHEQWSHGNSIGWSTPNTTDVHSVRNVKDLAAYVSKYMAKNLSETIVVKGLSALAAPTSTSRMWGCSYALSRAYKAHVEIYDGEYEPDDSCLYGGEFQVKQILGNPDKAGMRHSVADVIFLKSHHWHGKVKGKYYRVFCSVRTTIQNEYRQKDVVSKMLHAPPPAVLN
jgi:hypothetical protein